MRERIMNESLTVRYKRATFYIKEEYLHELKARAFYQKATIKQIIDKILSEALKNGEKRSSSK